MLGGILSFKGSREFVAAAAIVSRVRPDAVFVIAGRVYRDGSDENRRYYEECMKEAEGLATPGCLRIIGEVGDTADLLAGSDVLVSPSSQTHFSRPVIEAWAHGVPVVAVKTDHMRNLVADGIDGFLTDPGDVAGLARAVARLLDEPELCRRLGEAGKKKVAEQFDAETNISKIVSLCERLIGPGRGGALPVPGSVRGGAGR
jgi:glycosyltransferase involved in cell wall biosynthesis